jgi:glycosyltransferase involved in cell wall biosynthesis
MPKILYISLSGGLGQFYDILFILFARFLKMRIYIHHHSFSYLDHRSHLTILLTLIGGPLATHVTLCSKMALSLKKSYPDVGKVISVSNATILFYKHQKPNQYKSKLQTIGFMGNISKEKGIFDFIKLIESLENEKIEINAKLAGPFENEKTEREVRRRINQRNRIEYVGPKYGSDKKKFLTSIDILVFPTHYADEAEPLIILEAMSNCIPVIAHGRGCIPEIVHSGAGRVINPVKPFRQAALAQIKEWIAFPNYFENASISAANCFFETTMGSAQLWENLITEIVTDR